MKKEGQWSTILNKYINSSEIDRFLSDITEVCIKHNISIGHEDSQGSFEFMRFDQSNIEWLEHGSICFELNGQKDQLKTIKEKDK